ncbi:Homocysteine S-methyltransferase 1 [Thoreauomyces humboldtii]|nr:Homocysteine S-methyltransferase 1 [Thoreauomyces humboldtii]
MSSFSLSKQPPVAETQFCPPPYIRGIAIAPCLVDVVSAAVLLAIVFVLAVFFYTKCLARLSPLPSTVLADIRNEAVASSNSNSRAFPRPGNSSVSERTPLLTPSSTAATLRERERDYSSATSAIARIAASAVLITWLVSLGFDFYQSTHPDVPSTITRDLSAHTLSSVLQSFAWLIATAVLFFVETLHDGDHHWRGEDLIGPTGFPFVIQFFIVLATLTESMQLYQWLVLFFWTPETAMSTMRSLLPALDAPADLTYFILFSIRYGMILVLATLLVAKHIAARRRASSTFGVDDMEASSPIAVHLAAASEESPGWNDTFRKVRKLMPFLWPKPVRLQILVILCFITLGMGRAVNVLVPLQYKRMVDALTVGSSDDPSARPYFCWGIILVYTGFRALQGGVGILSSIQFYLWIPVGQYTTREVSVRMLQHLHSLSLQFHINRKTGEVLRVMDRGTLSVGNLLSYLAFNIMPVFLDIGLACVVFLVTFDVEIASVVFTTMVLYITATIAITEWRARFRRTMNELDTAARAKAVDSLLNFETVKYYNNEELEVRAYDEALREYQDADYKSTASLNVLNTAQNLVISLGLLTGLLMCAARVADGLLTVGDFVAFLTYLLQLYQPLNWFGTYYRVIQQNFIDMEKMLDLFEEGEAVKDVPGARDLVVRQGGKITFDNVCFSYDPRQAAVKGLSFEIPAGKTVALVGPSGGGKSTVFRLLFRFYDIQSGSIKIDGQDIRSVKQTSLRSHIGVVPQDTVLFNDTVRYNIRYGNIEASDEEVVAAAKAAQIHDRILAFPDGYDTRVGERGLRLSGGEKQRIAIARTVLKSPSIILLDEATSALDNATERLVQDRLEALSQNRTTLVIAHRLSTVVDADLIIVLTDGAVAEKGTHDELMAKEGTYHHLWMRQLVDEGAEVLEGEMDAEGIVVVPPQIMPHHHHHH